MFIQRILAWFFGKPAVSPDGRGKVWRGYYFVFQGTVRTGDVIMIEPDFKKVKK